MRQKTHSKGGQRSHHTNHANSLAYQMAPRMRGAASVSRCTSSDVDAGKMELGVLASSLLALLLYWNTLEADFAYDDSRAILKNQDLLPETPITNIFYNDFWGTPLTHSGSHKSYRPLCVLTFRLNYYLTGLQPMGFHLGNVILHALVTGLFTFTAKCLVHRTFPATVAGVLFASHPIHTEAVAGVVGRADIMACLFFLLAFHSYMKYTKQRDKSDVLHTNDAEKTGSDLWWRWGYLVCVGLSTGASMLCKEQGVTVLAVCAIYDIFVIHRLKLHYILHIPFQKKYVGLLEGLLSLVLTGIGLIGFRIYFMGNKTPEFAPADNPASDSDSLLTRTLTYFYLPFLNFWLLLYPRLLSFDWSMEAVPLVESLLDVRNACTAVFYGGLLSLGYYIITNLNKHEEAKVYNGNGFTPHIGGSTHAHHKHNGHSKKRNSRRSSSSSTDSEDSQISQSQNRTLTVVIVSLALMAFPFIPATNLFFYVGFVIAERVLYIPSMGFCLLVAEGTYKLYRYYRREETRRQVVFTALSCLVCAYSVRTVVRNRDWLMEENLYRSGISVNPPKAWGNLANIFNSQGKHAEAEEAYKQALRYRGNMADVHYNLGILLQEQKRYKEAIESYKLAVQCRPRLTMAHLNLGIVYGILRRYEEAEKIYLHCAEIDHSGLKDPRLHESTKISALYNLGRLLADQDRLEEAVDIYMKAIKRRPSHYAPQSLYNMLGEAYAKMNRHQEAEDWYREALRAKPDHIPAHLTMAKLLHRQNKPREAEQWFQKAKQLNPHDGSIYQHYGQFLGELGRHAEAADVYIKAAEWSPEDFELVFNVANALRQARRNLEAELYYRKAAILRPDVATAHMNLGAMLHYNGKLEEAEQSYLNALRLKPDDSVTQTNLKKLRNLLTKKGKNGNSRR